ncbi:hypothetical protein CTAYLR_008466 [Chrysophaeum taylorii]|uniref:Uncharacterized protein n=1 Tax=Chrysophaeum taylorii TaxID=2483200 RepID=A0AAD7UBA2_9STRA|nr:hypothetical protein CTAYLR_008466 [Chrysophaeum taylorii]
MQMTGRGATSESILSLFVARGKKFSARNLATAAHRVAKFGGRGNDNVRCDRRVIALADACQRCIREFNPQNLANTAWAFARAGIDAPQLFAAIADAALSRLGEFNPQDLANTAWAVATAGIEAPRLFAVIADDLANTAWAVATAGIEAPRLFAVIADVIPSRLKEFNPQNLANTAWAVATAGIEAPQLFDAIALAVRSLLGEFNPQELANAAWAFACVDWKKDPEFFAELAYIVVTDLDALDDRGLSSST